MKIYVLLLTYVVFKWIYKFYITLFATVYK